MPDLIYESMPFRCFPGRWAPEIRRLLNEIAARLTPEQRAAFRLSELGEQQGRLVVCWAFVGAVETVDPRVDEEIEASVARAAERIQALGGPATPVALAPRHRCEARAA